MIILIFSIFLFLSATFGYGRLFLRINRLDDLNLSFGETGILGLFFLTFIGLSLHFFPFRSKFKLYNYTSWHPISNLSNIFVTN